MPHLFYGRSDLSCIPESSHLVIASCDKGARLMRTGSNATHSCTVGLPATDTVAGLMAGARLSSAADCKHLLFWRQGRWHWLATC